MYKSDHFYRILNMYLYTAHRILTKSVVCRKNIAYGTIHLQL